MTPFTNLSQSTTTVYQTLQKYSNTHQICEMSYNNLVKKSGYGKTVVINAVRELTTGQWIRKIMACNEEEGHLTNRYKLLR
ncbi:helix-turn-helix domain-containing protein [Candidatus Marithioploca araucensis]|uniref:Helix-turn-helix domain-containing protein n=1 Tax=Candidatus Marithioploca araucensis TaxID=70273 RepID=A0ABT7VSZ4_9GAMM|nr:helix-turn-helix domain-containing protein [Candidatus Marithioploca araucensis]